MGYDVFISYSAENQCVANAVYRALEKHGIKCRIAPRDIPVGVKYEDIINNAIKNCRIFIIIFSESASLSRKVKLELNVASDKEKPIIQYSIDQTPIKGAMRLLLNKPYRRIDSFPNAEKRLNELVTVAVKFLGINPLAARTAPRPKHKPKTPVYFPKRRKVIPNLKKPVIAGLCITAVCAIAILTLQFPKIQYYIGEQYYAYENYSEAVKWYRKAAEQDFVAAQYFLASCYANGKGIPQNYTEAVKWYCKAAEQGYTEAQYQLALCHNLGLGVKQDYTEAIKWYRKAAEQGFAAAQNMLGYCYENGRGVPQDYREAVKWFHQAAEQGHAYAQYNLGWFYYNGQGVTKNYPEAEKWHRKAIDQLLKEFGI